MAIETTYFTGTSATTNREEVIAWLKSNAGDYFDAFSTPAGYETIECKIGGALALKLDWNTSNYIFYAQLKNGAIDARYNAWSTSRRFTKGVKTDHGIFLYANAIENIFVTKNTDGGVMFAGYHSVGNSSYGRTVGDFETDSVFQLSNQNNGTGFGASQLQNIGVYSAGRTALVPVCTGSGAYSDSLFFVPYTQFVAQSGITIDVDGTKYVYNGVFALKE